MDKPIVTGLLAYGMSGKIFHAPFLDQHPGLEFIGVLERSKKNAQAEYPNIRSYDTAAELLNHPGIELLVINTPNNTHYEFAKQALEAGKHVLIEKPAATSLAEAKELFELGRKLNKQVMIYHNRRFSSDFLATKEVIESGKLGRIIEMHLRFDRYRNVIGPKKFKETAVPGSGIMYDLGSHLLDQVISLFGKPQRFYKTLGGYRENTEVDDFAHLHLIYPEQLNVFITASMLVADPQPGIVIHGTAGSFIKSFCDTQEEQLMSGMKPGDAGFGEELAGKEGKLTIMHSDGTKTTEEIPSKTGQYMGVFEAVYQTLRLGKPFPVKEEEIISQFEILSE